MPALPDATFPDAIDDRLAALSRHVLGSLPASARDADGAWDPAVVSTRLQALGADWRQRHEALEAELAAVESALATLGTRVPEETAALLARAQEIETAATEDLAPALERAEQHFTSLLKAVGPQLERLGMLDARERYLRMAVEVEERSQLARKHATEATMDALEAFGAFAAFVQGIPREYTALHAEAMRRVDELSRGLKQFAVDKLARALADVAWPAAPTAGRDPERDKPTPKETTALARAFAYLIALQLSQRQADAAADHDVVDLWAIECVLEPVRLRLRYHFERPESKTNRLTKPEWFLSHLLDQLRAFTDALDSILSPELEKHRARLICTDAKILFLRGLIITAQKKLEQDVSSILLHRDVFCHTVDEILLFEQAIDSEFGYHTFASTSPVHFPRLVSVLTTQDQVLFEWTKSDLHFAESALDALMKAKSAWSVDFTSQTAKSPCIPLIAPQFMTLLDFLCRRFAFMEEEGHRYLYVTQVHVVLLRRFHVECTNQYRGINLRDVFVHNQSIAQVCAIVNALQHAVEVLESWEQSRLFLELTRKVVESDKSRREILKMHLQYSKNLLKNAAKAASETIMAREEAVAVRQAIVGPGAMIGPTAAITAAYSVGSKTVKSLFGRAGGDMEPTIVANTEKIGASSLSPKSPEVSHHLDEEALFFSRTMFEHQLADYRGAISLILQDVREALMHSLTRAIHLYAASSHWSQSTPTAEVLLPSVSSELTGVFALLRSVLGEAKAFLSVDIFGQLWKPLIANVDDTISSCLISQGASITGQSFNLSNAATAIGAVAPETPTAERTKNKVWSSDAKSQLLVDFDALTAIVQVCTKNPKAHMRKLNDIRQLIEMDPSKLRHVCVALSDEECSDDEDTSTQFEQITTILEACGILALSPHTVQSFCARQLGAL